MRRSGTLLLASALAVVLVASSPCPAPARTPTPTFGFTPTPTPTSNRPVPRPSIVVRPNPAREGDTVLLDGSASTGAIFTVEWSQSGGPVQVEILNPTERTASFVVPPVAEVTTITFDFELTSFGGTSGAFARVEVTLLPPKTVLLELGTAIGAPGERVSIAATLRTAGEPTTAIEHALAFSPEAAVAALGSGLPSCSVDPAAGASEASFRFAPEGCTPGSDCERVLVAIAADEPLADGVVYRCDVDLTLDDADSCEHALFCALPQASGPSGPLALSCIDGKTIADWSVRGVSFAFDVEPPNPTVGEDVAVSVAVAGPGGLPSYRLRGAGPFLEGNTGPINASAFGTVRFDLDAVCPGTANLQLAVDYETLAGCPGMEFFRFTGAVSEVFPIEIVDPETFHSQRHGHRVPALSGRAARLHRHPRTARPDGADGPFDRRLLL
jgi:hypothetical protein